MNGTRRGYFITFEGPEGSGKTTQAKLLAERLTARGVPVLLTREPGGTPIGDRIRQLLLDPSCSEMAARCEFLLYAANRAQHIDEKIAPALQAGTTVISDRFIDASMAYQGYGRGLTRGELEQINAFAIAGRFPDLTVFLTVPVADGLAKAILVEKDGQRQGVGDRIEQAGLEFHERVAAGYEDLARQHPERIVTIDGVGTIAEVAAQIALVVDGRLAW